MLALGVVFGLWRAPSKSSPVLPTPKPTTLPLPTQTLTPLEASVATISAAITQFDPQDPTLAPPVLVLPLGFDQ